MNIYEKFKENNAYIFELQIPKTKYYLFVEGLNEFGESILGEFCLNKIKKLCIELCENTCEGGEFVETIDTCNIGLLETLDSLIIKTLNLIGE